MRAIPLVRPLFLVTLAALSGYACSAPENDDKLGNTDVSTDLSADPEGADDPDVGMGTGGGGVGGTGNGLDNLDDPTPYPEIPVQEVPSSIDVTGALPSASTSFAGVGEGTGTASGAPGSRSFSLSTTAQLRYDWEEANKDSGSFYVHQPGLGWGNPRIVDEVAGAPHITSQNPLFDGLFALALLEAREDSVDSISEGQYNDGAPTVCPPGGCFLTGRKWTYVWTRDTSYAVDLGLSWFDPKRSQNSMEFKLSERRDGSNLQIIQDTGSGGSYPISTDRTVWAFGAAGLLNVLPDADYDQFSSATYLSMKNTAEHDREVVFDPRDGIYYGEQSYLDWRQNTYPHYTATDTIHIGTSKALSTNIGQLRMLQVVAALAEERGEAADAEKFGAWANELAQAIHNRFFIEEDNLYSTYITPQLDGAAARQFDLLGTSLAILSGAVPEDKMQEVVSHYPVLEVGPPVIWPQQQDVFIYHNRSMWPFVTAYAAKAARRANHGPAAENAVYSLYRGAAVNLSNMENLYMVTGGAFFEESDTTADSGYTENKTGPKINSERQLWSVASYLSAVVDVIFGLDVSRSRLRIAPFITPGMHENVLGGSNEVVLNGFRLRDKSVSVKLTLPDGASGGAAYSVVSIHHNGVDVSANLYTPFEALHDENLFEIVLTENTEAAPSLRLVSDTSKESLFGPKDPAIESLTLRGGNIDVSLDLAGESGIHMEIFRDGELVADVPAASSWSDSTGTSTSPSHCYSVRTYYTSSGNRSNHAQPSCFFGPGYDRVEQVAFSENGGSGQDWGDPSDTITGSYSSTRTGLHNFQVTYSNGAKGYDSGIWCGVKRFEVWDGSTVVGAGYLVMPHTGYSWDEQKDSNVVGVELEAGKTYDIVISEDSFAINMSEFEHNVGYEQSRISGRFNKVHVRELKVLPMVN